MASFNSEFLQRVKDSVNMLDIIGSYVKLKKQGRYYMASCPFHGPEKTPSFAVSPEKGFYYCFGCHASGDIITFIEKMENLSFGEAVERLAQIAHVEIPKQEMSAEEAEKARRIKALYDVTELAGSYFYNCLTRTNMGKAGLAYFSKRNLTRETIDRFKLGFAPDSWHRLYQDFTEKKHIPADLLAEAGLCGVKNGRYFDMFRNRCMYPILDLRGRVVAFGGRVMDDSKPKYLNSPESPIFNKRRLLFGLYQALPEIKKKRQAIMVEGYMDVISLHAHNVTNAVASLGTAFTIEQARLLKKYADEIVFSYDMDDAGQNATKRALEIAGSIGIKLRVATVGDGKDPDEFVNLHGGEAYLAAIERAEPALDYLFHSLRKKYDDTTLEGQHRILDDMFSALLAEGDTFRFNSFIRKMALAMHMDEGIIRSEALTFARKNHSHIYISDKVTADGQDSTERPADKRQGRLETGFIRYCLAHGFLPEGWETLKNYRFSVPFLGKLFEIFSQDPKNISQTYLERHLDRNDIEKLAELQMEEEQTSLVPLEDYIWPLKRIYLQNEYRIHTENAQKLLLTDPAQAKEEQLLCVKLNKEIIALGRMNH